MTHEEEIVQLLKEIRELLAVMVLSLQPQRAPIVGMDMAPMVGKDGG